MGFFCSAFQQHLAATICVFAHPPSKQTPKAKKPATSKSTKSTKSKGVSKQTPATKQSSAKVKKEVGIVVRDTVALSVNPLGANRRR